MDRRTLVYQSVTDILTIRYSQPMLGRYFASDEEGPKSLPVVVLSYAFIDSSGSAADFRGRGRFPNRYSMMRLDKR